MITRYLPLAGTHSRTDGWVIDDGDPFTLMMRRNRFVPIRQADGSPWNWSTKLQGLFWTGTKDWYRYAVLLAAFLETIPYADRNLIAHSHGGQLPLIAASSGTRIRTLTTVGTPRRKDIPAQHALPQIGFWQHIYDMDRDVIATMKHHLGLGQVGDGAISFERRFLLPGVVNIGVKDIGHSSVLRDAVHMRKWETDGWLDAIRISEE